MISFLQTNFTTEILSITFNFKLLRHKNHEHGSKNLCKNLLDDVVSFQNGVSDSYEYKVGATDEEHKFIKKYILISSSFD